MHIITMLFLLSILILVHELGHFSVAKMFGLKVDRFGFGLPFGPTIYEKKWGDTIICVHAFLLGGYVSFPDDDPDSDLAKDDYRRIANRPVWQRFCVVSAGVIANAITALVIVIFVAAFSGGIPSGKYDIYAQGLQDGQGYSSHQTGIQPEDKIVSANGVNIDSPIKFQTLAQRSKLFDGYVAEKNIQNQLEQLKKQNPAFIDLENNDIIPRGVNVKLVQATYEPKIELSDDFFIGMSNYEPEGHKLNPGQADLRNKLENKNEFISNGKVSLYDLAISTADTVHPIDVIVEREGKQVRLKTAYPNKDGLIGIKLRIEEIRVPTTGFKSVMEGSWSYLYQNTAYMVSGLWKLISGQVDVKDLHGIVAITKVGSDIIEHKGIWDGLLLTALISMDLAIVNLFPIPALDGGHLVFLIIEKFRGRPLEKDTQENFAKYGFIFLIGLMVFIIFNDIFSMVTGQL